MKRIYISDAIHEHLKREAKRDGRTLQWVVENKLTDGSVTSPSEIGGTPKNTEPETYKEPVYMKLGGTAPSADVSGLLNGQSDSELNEQPCCLNELAPCKHWVWDINTGEGYKNSLSGRYKEAE